MHVEYHIRLRNLYCIPNFNYHFRCHLISLANTDENDLLYNL